MKPCINNEENVCIGRDCRVLKSNGYSEICCYVEIMEEAELAQGVIDAINDFTRDNRKIKDLCGRFSFASSVINKSGDKELETILPMVSRFSYLVYDCREKIESDVNIRNLISFFIQKLKRWFQERFLYCNDSVESMSIQKTLEDGFIAIEAAFGVCTLNKP